MRILLVVITLSALSACNTVQSGMEELRSATGGFVQGDPNGTSRRPDLYGRSTQPSTPTIANR
jgi:hypothetical protein